MVGPFKRFFEQRKTQEGESDTVRSFGWRRQSRDFFLSPDEAKTLGDIDYMRTPKTIHHTFPKIDNPNEGKVDFYDEVSSLGHFSSSRKH